MRNYLLKQIFKAFEMMNRCHGADYDNPVGGGGEPEPVSGNENTDIIEEKDIDPEPIDVTTYRGNKEINPSQRPMKEFDRTGLSTEDIDNMIKNSDGDIFLSDEQIKKNEAEKEDKEKEENKEKDVKKEDETGKDKEGGEKETDEKEDEQVKEFYEKTGLTEDEFVGLSEKAQENLFNKVFTEDSGSSDQLTAITGEKDKLQADMDTLLEDEFIALRVQEKTTGKKFIVKPEDIVTDEFFVKVDALLDKDKTEDAKKLLTDTAAALLKSERQVGEKRTAVKEGQKATWDVLRELGKIDKRLAIKETHYEKLKPGHKEWDKYKGKDGLGEAVEFLEKKGHNFQTIKNYTADEIYTLFSKSKGWDKDRDKSISNNAKKSVLEKLRNPKMAKSLKQGKSHVIPGSRTASMGFDRDTLKAELVKGDGKRYQQLIEASEGKPKMTAILGQILYEAEKEREKIKT